MKQNTNNIITASRKACWLPLVAFAAMLLSACTADDTLMDGNGNIPVAFTAGLQSATPNTRTAIGTNGETIWKQGDAVGIFMLSASQAMPIGIIADNSKYTVTPATGALVPAGTPIYYPRKEAVDFVAYYPYAVKGTGNGKVTEDYKYQLSVTSQSHPEAIDVLYAKVTGAEKSGSPVNLPFGHVLSKIRFDITLDNRLADLAGSNITATTITGMPASATLALHNGTLTPGTATGNISARKLDRPSEGAAATFEAIVVPQSANAYSDRQIIVTVGGKDFIGTIPNGDAYMSNEMYIYPVTVQESSIYVGNVTIARWNTRPHASGTLEPISETVTVTFDANGGSNPPVKQEVKRDMSITLPDGSRLTPPQTTSSSVNYNFVGWSTTSDYSGEFYRAGTEFIPTNDITLYAVWTGDGTSDAFPTLIFDARGLADMNDNPDGYYSLMKDITVTNWEPVGTQDVPFRGQFNGLGHTVTINSMAEGSSYIGLFGKVRGSIQQVCVAGNITYSDGGLQAAGGIAGEAGDGSLIENCLVTANLNVGSTNPILGGILGRGPDGGDENAFVRNCLVLGNLTVNGNNGYIGGIGAANNIEIVNCVVLSGSIKGSSDFTGNIYRIGPNNATLSNNYGNRDARGKMWLPIANGIDGANCDAQPNAAWWGNTGTWKTDGGCEAWNFISIWETGVDGYPRLRIVQP